MAALVVLKSAQLDFDDIKKDFRQRHSKQGYEDFKDAFKTLFKDLKAFPESGATVEEARAFGLNVRQRICQQVRVVYTYDSQSDTIQIRMFLPTQCEFLTHLTTRILRPAF